LHWGVSFAFCLWQNHVLLNILNRPLHKTTTSHATGPLEQTAKFQTRLKGSLDQLAKSLDLLAKSDSTNAAVDRSLQTSAAQLRTTVGAIPTKGPGSVSRSRSA